ncbi:hypothetical protein [Mucilaginibacter sp. dw_454]|uniref:hypothetical protein n=1 Tax=Mucilaginibacter sp. dw_454 TaxID=2720079 RepID=UPI001BD5FABA|nr:hypothetical protein [Mucilaginibacter sp. dw_454]
MKILNTSFKLLLPALLLTVTANAQKLPKIQTASVLAPANTKVDGKTTEFGNKFQAFNRTTEVYYTLSNSATKLYLTIQSNERRIVKKVIANGITLTIMADPKQSKDGLAVTFPTYGKSERPPFYNLRNPYLEVKDTTVNNAMADSVMNTYNTDLTSRLKMIGVIGDPNVPDSTLSVFNTEGFKAAGRFDHKLAFTFELAIPLSLIKFAADKPGYFKYTLQVNGPPGDVQTDGNNQLYYIAGDGSRVNIGWPGPDNLGFSNPTSFSGEYTLAK